MSDITIQQLSLEIQRDICYSTEFLFTESIGTKIKNFIKRIFVEAQPFEYTSLTSNVDINAKKFNAYIRNSVPLPDIMLSVPRGFSSNYPTALTTLKSDMDLIDILSILNQCIDCFSELNISILKDNDLSVLQNIKTLLPDLTIGQTKKNIDQFNINLPKYFHENYKGNKTIELMDCKKLFLSKQMLDKSATTLSDLTNKYNFVVNRVKPQLDACYKILDTLLQTIIQKSSQINKDGTQQLYTLINTLSILFDTYGKLLAEIQVVEFNVVLGIKNILATV